MARSLRVNVLGGVVGGIVASYAMNRFHVLWARTSPHGAKPTMVHGHPTRGPRGQGGQLIEEGGAEAEPPTMVLADRVAEHVQGRRLSEPVASALGELSHYAFGASAGAAYGVLASVAPQVTLGAGVPYGIAVWLSGDEFGTHLFGLSTPPTSRPGYVHRYSFLAHCVYGVVLEGCRQAMDEVLDRST